MRVATYNIKHGALKGREAIEAVLRRIGADLVGLQEVDVGVRRSGGVDQARHFAAALGLESAFGPAFPHGGGLYGVALLSRWPVRVAEAIPLPAVGEPRVLLVTELAHPEGPLTAAVTHFGLDPGERIRQAEVVAARLAGIDRLILVGDFNASHSEASLAPLRARLVDAAVALGRAPLRTYPSDAPTIGIDHVLLGPGMPPPRRVEAIPADASDHLPVVVDLG